ncbi:MAG: ATP-binding protein [Nitrospirota bacterium]
MFRKAERKKAKLRLGIAGPAGSGKTYSALIVAQGLGGKVAMIDTEHGSGELYSHLYDYDIATLEPPFTPEKYMALIREAEKEGYSTVILDSISHAWAGEGGLLDLHDKISKTSGNSFTAWREVTPKHNALVEAMLGSPCHIIATMRSKQEYTVTTNDKGKTEVRKVGLAPIQRDGMEYEFTVFLELSLDHLAVATKDRTSLFDGKGPFIPNGETGKTLLEWLETGIDPVEKSKELLDSLVERMKGIENIFHLRNWWSKHAGEINELIPEHKSQIINLKEEMKLTLKNGEKAGV